MSFSPPIRRLSTGSAGTMRHQEELINAYEAEEERIINVLSRKLEQLREDKIDLENTLEAESESHVNKLQRELAVLKGAFEQLQIQVQQNSNGAKTTTAASSTSIKPRDINNTPAKNSTSSGSGTPSPSPSAGLGFRAFMSHSLGFSNPADPSAETMLEAMRRENEQLRGRLVDTERDYIRISRLNEIYREELIDYRRRLGVSVDSLIGLSNSDPFNQPTHHRHSSSSSGYSYHSGSSSPSTSMYHIPRHSHSNSHVQPFGSYNPPMSPHPSQAHSHSHHSHSHSHGVPIPRPPSQIHRPKNIPLSESNTPLSHSPSSASASGDSPFPFSPSSANPASFVSVSTNVTSPPSSGGLGVHGMGMVPSRSLALTYPSVPPPSLSSSFGSPSVPFYVNGNPRDASLSPIEPLSRRNSTSSYHGYGAGGGGGGRRVAETGSLRSAAGSRRASFDRGARVAETGSLLGGPGSLGSGGAGGGAGGTGSGGRSRAGSHSHGYTYTFPETVDEAEDLDLNQAMELGEEGDVVQPTPPKGVDLATKSR